jgi:small subunit ribosomal protein S6e
VVEFKLVIADGPKSYARTVSEPQAAGFLGKRIGESVGGDLIGLSGYTLKIAGGTDRSGFPLRPDLPGARQARLLVGHGFGFHAPRRGMRRRRTFRGGAVSEETVQINLVVDQRGAKPLPELLQAPA